MSRPKQKTFHGKTSLNCSFPIFLNMQKRKKDAVKKIASAITKIRADKLNKDYIVVLGEASAFVHKEFSNKETRRDIFKTFLDDNAINEKILTMGDKNFTVYTMVVKRPFSEEDNYINVVSAPRGFLSEEKLIDKINHQKAA